MQPEKGLKASRLSSPPPRSIQESQAAFARSHEQRQQPLRAEEPMAEDGTAAPAEAALAAAKGLAAARPRTGRAHRRAAPGPGTLQRGRKTEPAAAFGVGHIRAAFLLAARWCWSRANTSLEHWPGRSCGTRRSSLPRRVTRDRVSGPCDRRAGRVPPPSTSTR